ncbi:MAG: hypothetical protein NTU53_09635 [Planctomycetota bacterium]|nr:hypothetical protein [Planctomycetota bacterium]
MVYEALFLRGVVGFEGFCDALFSAILEKKIRYKRFRVALRVTAKPDVFREVLLQGDRYLTWLPYRETEKRANLYLEDGRPFTVLDDGEKSKLSTITTIRNAIAHVSDYALNQFTRLIENKNLPPRWRTPAAYLRAQLRNQPAQNYFQVYMAELGAMAAKICA